MTESGRFQLPSSKSLRPSRETKILSPVATICLTPKICDRNQPLTLPCHGRRMARDSFAKTAAPLVVLTFLGIYNLPPVTQQEQKAAIVREAEAKEIEQSVYYAGCNEVRAQGLDPLYRGDPGYREGMDGDGDGVACEPYYGD